MTIGTCGLTFQGVAERVPFLRALSPQQLALIQPFAQIRQFRAGQPVFALGEPSHEYLFLVAGHIKLLRRYGDGREVILDIRAPGDLICAGAVTAVAPYCCSSVALDKDITIVALPRRDLSRLFDDNPSIGQLFSREAAHHEMRMADRVFEIARGHVEQRVGAALLRLADRIGESQPDGSLLIQLRLSRQDLADLCGTTLESAIRTMVHLGRENIIQTVAGGFVVTNRGRLARLAK